MDTPLLPWAQPLLPQTQPLLPQTHREQTTLVVYYSAAFGFCNCFPRLAYKQFFWVFFFFLVRVYVNLFSFI